MRVEALDRSLSQQIDGVVMSLREHGKRTVWLDPFGALWHAEPEDEDFDVLGHRYIGTFCQPSVEELCGAVAGIGVPHVSCLHVA